MIKHISSLELFSAVDYKYPFIDSNAKKKVFFCLAPKCTVQSGLKFLNECTCWALGEQQTAKARFLY